MESKCVLMTDFQNVCRICMQFNESFISISSLKIIDMIVACASVEICENDELPRQICNACFLQLQTTINFKQLCEKSDRTFRQIIEQSKIKIETDDQLTSTVDIKEEIFEADTVSHNSYSLDVKNEYGDAPDSDEEKLKIECETCHQEFKKVHNLGLHMQRVHEAKGIKCSQCPLVCYHPLHLTIHEKSHTEGDFPCEICHKSFSGLHKLTRHKLTHGERTFSCSECDVSFKDKYALHKHIKIVHTVEQYEACHICGKSLKKAHFAKHLATHGDRVTLSCDVCSKQFYCKYNLVQHIKHVHENVERVRKHLCNICGKGFQKMDDLRRHFLTHTNEKPYKCDQCDKCYRRKYSLTTHVSHAHLNERKHICSYCSQAFFNKEMLQNHVRRHTGEKPYQCRICDKAFIQKISLNLHMKVHANSV